MKKKLYLKILIVIVALIILSKLAAIVFIEPWVGKKIQASLNKKSGDYRVEIDKVHIYIIKSGIELESITICSKQDHSTTREFMAGIDFIKFRGINLVKVLFKKDIYIREVNISKSNITGKIPFSRESTQPIVLQLNIRIAKIHIDTMDLVLENTLTAQSYSVKKGILKVYDLQVDEKDTLSTGIVKKFDFEAKELVSVSSDSMYSYTASGIFYFATSNTLEVNSFTIDPNYTEYNFTSRYEFQTDRIEAGFSNIFVHDFYAAGYLISGSLISSYIEIGNMDMKVFRDKRKEFRHVIKPAFQDMIYNYQGTIKIDSIGLTNGIVTYTEHAEEANKPGFISFNEINAKIYQITNDTIYKTESAFIVLKADALFMEKGNISILLKARVFDIHNTFSLNGTLSGMEASELNPILEKSAYVYATAGKIDAMNFSFTANNSMAAGKMTLLYHGLDLAVKNKRTDDTTAFKERFISLIANWNVKDSNPTPGEGVREGIIDYERDPEKFLFSYCFKSILSGIKSSMTQNPKKS